MFKEQVEAAQEFQPPAEEIPQVQFKPINDLAELMNAVNSSDQLPLQPSLSEGIPADQASPGLQAPKPLASV